ncbi:MAG TPA: zinc-ribbon and DUF3426 domain-containing protein [Steroidobacteraceae bacterium]|nr:zinc-ribbon and DUF3426 domain-containing protein [Steroidobacteraceae bacterium]
MYTQCSKCETVFSLSADVLRTAGGQVRCGKCGEVFNALARLAEDSSAFTAGESSLELETRADSILESLGPAQGAQEAAKDGEDFARPGVEIARIEIMDWPEDDSEPPSDDDRSLEFTLPPGELDRIFVESKKAAARMPPLTPPGSPASPASPTPPAAPAAPTAPTPPIARTAPTQPSQPSQPSQPETAPLSQPLVEIPHPESVLVDVPRPARNRVSGFEVPEDVRREMLAGFEQHILPSLEPGGGALREVPRRSLIVWLSAAIAAALLLGAQIVHQNRDWMVVRALYGAMGSPLPAPSNLSAYQLRQWGVTGDPDANGTLRLRASILNGSAQLQPYPLLRVTLADRFGKSIGQRDFEPSEYMGKPTARLLAPGERADATLEILDPGKNAEGFEIDVCLRGADRRVACANDVAPQAAP